MAFKKQLTAFLLPLLFCIHTSLFSQEKIPVIRVKSIRGITFFQTGTGSDTIIKNKSDRFYLVIPDSLSKDISVLTENAQFQKTNIENEFKLVYLQGLKYESSFSKNENNILESKSLINGASSFDIKKIRIQLLSKKEGNVILENVFFYKGS